MTATNKTSSAKKTLVIVESPSKAKTIGKYLGARYRVIASVGHVRDLPKSKLGIDIAHDFEPQYIPIRGKGEIIKELKKEAKKASKVYLATDPDREGEAISWHLAFLLGIDPATPCRIVFHEITKNTIREAIKHPRPIDLHLVDAQQARRVLDRLVGYQISPLLWRKVRKGLSAGRVQSVALKILCDREREIRDFVPSEYWTITAAFAKGKGFTAKLMECEGKKLRIGDRAENDRIIGELARGTYQVSDLTRKERVKRPNPPFTTSSMQQEASTRLNFNTRKTMLVAQQLYEGVEIKGHGSVGLITYLRTDSVRISAEATGAASAYITDRFGASYVGHHAFTNRKRDIQDAHEAIRPSDLTLEPDQIKDSLSADQYKLYRLIWRRFMASQMASARFDQLQVAIRNGPYTFRTTGSKLVFDGYQRVYKDTGDEDRDRILPPLTQGEYLEASEVSGEQSFTQPPPRYTEASLVRELEEKNIGRPSTYAPIVSTLSERKYVSREKKTLIPSELGTLVNNLMEEYFQDIVDVNFTSEMEDRLDDVEMQRRAWKQIISEFYGPFARELEAADAAIEKVQVADQPTGEVCERCGRPMVRKTGRFGEFIACSGYPECKNTRAIVQSIGVSCPLCGKEIVARRSKRGRVFYGCSGYPDCKQSYWDKPVAKACPVCGALLVEKRGQHSKLACSNPSCNYKE